MLPWFLILLDVFCLFCKTKTDKNVDVKFLWNWQQYTVIFAKTYKIEKRLATIFNRISFVVLKYFYI